MLFAAVHESGRTQNGHGAMSGLSLLWAAKRTWQIISVPVDWACSAPASVYAIAPVARRWVIGTSGILPPMGDQGWSRRRSSSGLISDRMNALSSSSSIRLDCIVSSYNFRYSS